MKKIFIIVFVMMLLLNVSVYAEPSKLDIENGYKYYVILAYNSGVQYYIEAQYPFNIEVDFEDDTLIRSYIKENGKYVYSEDLYVYKSTDNGESWNFYRLPEYKYFRLSIGVDGKLPEIIFNNEDVYTNAYTEILKLKNPKIWTKLKAHLDNIEILEEITSPIINNIIYILGLIIFGITIWKVLSFIIRTIRSS